jgi:uncharacterized membrane protein
MSEIDEVQTKQPIRHKWTYVEMLVSSILSLTASLVLSVDSWKLAKDPHTVLSCNISATISCGKVAESWQSVLLGFPNAFLGLIAEPVVITIAIAALGGSLFRRGFLLTAQGIYSIGLVFAYWLFYQSYFNIGALCPWCLLVTFTTTTVFMTMTRINILDNNFRLPAGLHAKLSRLLALNIDTATVLLAWASLASLIIFKYA